MTIIKSSQPGTLTPTSDPSTPSATMGTINTIPSSSTSASQTGGRRGSATQHPTSHASAPASTRVTKSGGQGPQASRIASFLHNFRTITKRAGKLAKTCKRFAPYHEEIMNMVNAKLYVPMPRRGITRRLQEQLDSANSMVAKADPDKQALKQQLEDAIMKAEKAEAEAVRLRSLLDETGVEPSSAQLDLVSGGMIIAPRD